MLALYSSLSPAQQHEIFGTSTRRKCIVSTNIAETSLTIDGIAFVIDNGMVKQSVYNVRANMEMLHLVPISKAAANQRAGRAGRTQPGVCYRLYTQQSFQDLMPNSTRPAVMAEDLISVVLMLKAAGFHRLLDFEWLDTPSPEQFFSALQRLNEQ